MTVSVMGVLMRPRGGQLTQLVFVLYTCTHAYTHTYVHDAYTHTHVHVHVHNAHPHTPSTHTNTQMNAHLPTGTFGRESALTEDCFENGYKLKQAGRMAREAGQAGSDIQYLPNGGFNGTDGEGLHAEGWCVPRL